MAIQTKQLRAMFAKLKSQQKETEKAIKARKAEESREARYNAMKQDIRDLKKMGFEASHPKIVAMERRAAELASAAGRATGRAISTGASKAWDYEKKHFKEQSKAAGKLFKQVFR